MYRMQNIDVSSASPDRLSPASPSPPFDIHNSFVRVQIAMYNRSTRSSSQQAKRHNIPGTFVPASQPLQSVAPQHTYTSPLQQVWPQPEPVENPPPLLPTVPSSNNSSDDNNYSEPKKWMKKGFKVSMREKRRRQNKTLRRLLTPKNALMVLNELSAGAQQECTVLPEAEGCGSNPINRQYVAVLNMGGIEYSGKGPTKLMAKNQAAECVIRDMMIKQMNQLPTSDSPNGNEASTMTADDEKEDQSFPMIQLASYALHKLFTEWQTEGYKVPSFGPGKGEQVPPNPAAGVVPNTQLKPKKTPSLPANPENLHPCTLLSQMRGTLEYVMIGREDLPMNGQCFTMGVTIDDKMYTGRATSKKEARKQAAAKACKDLYGIDYPSEEKMDLGETSQFN